ncbi:MAG: hypothetical protein QOE91_385, partial [Gaiellaceae bacterium]|nr:hypothetical protein [Gaiellaceae bacterium]
MRRALALVPVAAFLFSATAAPAAPLPTRPVYDSKGHLIEAPLAPAAEPVHLTQKRALAIFLATPKVRDWLKRYPTTNRVTETTYSKKYRNWTVKIWWGKAGEIATGRVDDATGLVTEAWTGPAVAWKMARGGAGAFGGKKINSYPVWLGFCALFLLALADWRRPQSLRNHDLVALLSFSVSLWYFNRGDILTSAPLVYPPLLYLIGRGLYIGITGRATRGTTRWSVWILLALTMFAAGFRVGLNVRSSNVIDVGYAGVIGAERIVKGQVPYGHMPIEDSLKPCGPKDQDGEIRDRVQTNGRCESANDRGDTYGPVSYESYIPGYLAFGWTGKWDDLPAAHATSIAFDLLCMLGIGLVGLRFGGPKAGAALALAWTAYPFTQYASSSNTNDAIMPAYLIWGFWLVTMPFLRGFFAALAGWTKFAALIVVPMWATYPNGVRAPRHVGRFVLGFAAATAAAFSIFLLEPQPLHSLHEFWKWTVSWQIGRDSPFSIWDWGQYHAKGIPDLHLLQRVLEVLLIGAAFLFAIFPRFKSPLQLAALTGVLLMGFELVLTHWFYLYLPWFFAFVAFAVLAARPVAETV